MKNTLTPYIRNIDEFLSRMQVRVFKERNSLITILFHGLFNSKDEIALNHAMPQQAITTDIFRQFIEYYLAHDYKFISPTEILNGLSPDKKYILITFDDGYYNNQLALPILNEYQVPAVFFISIGHVLQSKCFWWDIIYRERLKRNNTMETIEREILSLKEMKNQEIEHYILKNFGDNAFTPISNIDRPFTPEELHQFAKNKYVFLGNHTTNHAILTNYSLTEIKNEIMSSQQMMLDVTGSEPEIIAYPNGNFSPDMIPVLKECGLKLGVTVSSGKNLLPINIDTDDAFLLNRFTLWSNKSVSRQCELFRSDLKLFETLKRIKQRNKTSHSY